VRVSERVFGENIVENAPHAPL